MHKTRNLQGGATQVDMKMIGVRTVTYQDAATDAQIQVGNRNGQIQVAGKTLKEKF